MACPSCDEGLYDVDDPAELVGYRLATDLLEMQVMDAALAAALPRPSDPTEVAIATCGSCAPSRKRRREDVERHEDADHRSATEEQDVERAAAVTNARLTASEARRRRADED